MTPVMTPGQLRQRVAVQTKASAGEYSGGGIRACSMEGKAMQGSAPGRMGSADWKKVLKGFVIAMAGAGVAYTGAEGLPFLNSLGMGWLAPLGAVLVNMLVKWSSDTRG